MCANVLTKDEVGNYIFHYLLLFGNISNQGRFVDLSKTKERREIVLNQMILVGRLTHDITVEKNKEKDIPQENKKYAIISLAIPRSFKNSEGVYDTDFIDCYAFDNIAMNTSEYCHKGDIVGVKGRIQRIDSTSELQLIAEKVTFLSSKPKED